MAVAATYLAELRTRLQNPAVSDDDLTVYLNAAFRDVSEGMYSATDFDAMVMDTACQMLAIDGKFPEVSSVSSQGVSTSFAPNDPERWRRRLAARRQAYWMRGT